MKTGMSHGVQERGQTSLWGENMKCRAMLSGRCCRRIISLGLAYLLVSLSLVACSDQAGWRVNGMSTSP